MQFLLTGTDGKDEDALNRRMTARPAHLANAEKMKNEGTLVLGGALLDESGKMVGSIMILNMASRQEVDKYLEGEPYISANVWQNIQIQNLAVADHYLSEAAANR